MAYVDLTTRFVYSLSTVFGDFNKLANNDKFINENGWQDGTVGIFFQAAAPVGWTKVTTVNARALRIVSGSGGGVGGTTDPATTITLAHTHAISSDSAHVHTADVHTHVFNDQAAQASGSDFPSNNQIGINTSGYLRLENLAGSTIQDLVSNRFLTPASAVTSDSNGSHDHGGVTNSQLTNITLSYCNVLFCSKDTSSGYTDLSSTFVHNVRHVFDYLSRLAQNDAFNYARRTPAGTISIFGTPASPTGWTKVSANDGNALRVTNGAGGGDGGSYDGRTQITLAHNHGALTSDGSHSHAIPNHQHLLTRFATIAAADVENPIWATGAGGLMKPSGSSGAITGIKIKPNTTTDGGGTTTSDGSHQHATGGSLANITLAYFHVIQASKDSSGAPHSYTDMTAFFADQNLLAYQELQTMAYSDAYLYYHTMPASSVMFFFQSSAPLNWTKLITQNDKILIMTSGGDGGSTGGSASISGGITLAHTHTLDTKSHTHTYSHAHAVDTTSSTVFSTVSSTVVTIVLHAAADAAILIRSPGSAAPGLTADVATTNMTMDSYSHSHGGATQNALSNVTLAYADVIMCTKN